MVSRFGTLGLFLGKGGGGPLSAGRGRGFFSIIGKTGTPLGRCFGGDVGCVDVAGTSLRRSTFRGGALMRWPAMISGGTLKKITIIYRLYIDVFCLLWLISFCVKKKNFTRRRYVYMSFFSPPCHRFYPCAHSWQV